jgi:PAS domain S-box-containing protein
MSGRPRRLPAGILKRNPWRGIVYRRREEEPVTVDTARAHPSDSLHRDGIVEAVAFAAERLLLSTDWHEAADEVLARLGRAVGVSRAYIAGNVVDGVGRLTATWMAEWTGPGIVRVMDDINFRSAPWEESGFGRWSQILSRGDAVLSAVADLPKAERPPLELHGVVSLAKFPVFVGGEWWGAIGFDDCVRVRDWSGDELAALKASASVLGAALERQRLDGRTLDADEPYRTLVEHIPAVVYVEAPEGDPEHFYISPQVEAVFGYPASDWRWITDFWIDHVHPDDRPRVIRDDERTNVERAPFSFEYRFQAADGDWRWVRDEATFVEGPDGGVWQGLMMDITQRKRAEETLRDAELKFRTIVEQNEAIFYTQQTDPDDPAKSLTTYVAPGNMDLIGYSTEDIENDPTLWQRIIHPDDRERVVAAHAKSNAEGRDRFSMEYRIVRKGGQIIWVQDQAALARLNGNPPYWQGFLLDVTERKVAEEQRARALDAERDAAQRLRALDEMKNTFLQAVSHDLRTPLAAILGLAVTLERGDVELDTGDTMDLAGRIAENARKLERLVTDLLDMDRLARGIVSPKLERVDVGEVVRRVVIESDQIERSHLTMDLHPIVIPVDASKIERIVENLLANTARHTPSHAHVWVSVHPHEQGALIKVEDSGVGVPTELRESLFEPFQQGPDAPQHSPGVGVGLTLVRRFAELHGGRAWIEDREGGGASFQVFLPGSPPIEATV